MKVHSSHYGGCAPRTIGDYLRLLFCLPLSILVTSGLGAEEIRLAVAANFIDAITELKPVFEKHMGHKLVPVFGSTGKFYLQIKNGAPFEIILAADEKHPALLESEGIAVKGTRFAYAIGKLVLWSNRENYVDDRAKILETQGFRSLAMANPDIAPYGAAAREYLMRRKLWDTLQGRLVLGQDIGQTFHFVATGNAEMGFVALSQLKRGGGKIPGSYYMVPGEQYRPLVQQAVLIRESPAGRAFMEFLKNSAAKKIIRAMGYTVP